MLTVAYLANRVPAAVEPYVSEEIGELRRRGVRVIPGSVRRTDSASLKPDCDSNEQVLCLQPFRSLVLLSALFLAASRWSLISELLKRVLLERKEKPSVRLKVLLHTWLGAYYAVLLRELGVDHIHVHHGYFGSWIAMVAARLLGVSFSMTLHGSDLLCNSAYLDTKLRACSSCITISEYNRQYIIEHFPGLMPGKVHVARLGVDSCVASTMRPSLIQRRPPGVVGAKRRFRLLAVGRLHEVKNHAFLVRACARLSNSGLDLECVVAGEGPERPNLENLIRKTHLEGRLMLLGHVERERTRSLYEGADVVVLTSLSEGIPLVLMEAMATGGIVLAPTITGIPELITPGKTGFLYEAGSEDDFVRWILFIENLMERENSSPSMRINWIRHAARAQILNNFNRDKNLGHFGDWFLERIEARNGSPLYEDIVLQ